VEKEKQATCKTCDHYRRHYILEKERCTAVNCGHCVCVRVKKRRPDDLACGYYQYRDNSADIPDRLEVIDYLSKDFLKSVLEKCLPPYIDGD